ncbi:MAG TPA: hypothetical protein VKU01_11335 [Bryobacteraceae bacterium]|nr:hypothetical protein [Bryobacteraceae bacterium]
MNIDAELESWREQWQSETALPVDLRRRVERQTRWMKAALVGDLLVTLVIGGGVIWAAARSPQTDMFVLAGMTWVFIAAAWAFTLWVNHRNWSPSAMDTAAFIDLSIRRCRGRLAAVRFGVVLFVTEIVFCLAWIYQHDIRGQRPLLTWLLFGSLEIDITWLFTIVFAGLMVWYRRKKRAELEYLLRLSKPE